MINKKILVIVLAVLIATPCLAEGGLTFSGRAGYFTPFGTSTPSPMFGLAAYYDINENLKVRGAVETTTYTLNNQQTTFIPASLDLIYGQWWGDYLYPYASAGLSYNSTSINGGQTSQTVGGQVGVGIDWYFGPFSAGIEYRYFVPNWAKLDQASLSYNAHALGTLYSSILF